MSNNLIMVNGLQNPVCPYILRLNPVRKREKYLSFSLRSDLRTEGTDEKGLGRHPSAEPKTLWLWSVKDTSKDSLPKFNQ